MYPPQYSGVESIPNITNWFIENDEKIRSEIWKDNYFIELINNSIAHVFSGENVEETINRLFHEYIYLLSQLEEASKANAMSVKEQQIKGLVLKTMIRKAELRIMGWIFFEKYNYTFKPYGNPYSVLGLFDNFTDHYKILGIPSQANKQEINDAYQQLMKEIHPDVGGDPVYFMKVQAAYDVLIDDEKRTAFDEQYNLLSKKDLYEIPSSMDEFFTYDFKPLRKTERNAQQAITPWKKITAYSILVTFILVAVPFLYALLTTPIYLTQDAIQDTHDNANTGKFSSVENESELSNHLNSFEEYENYLNDFFGEYGNESVSFFPLFSIQNEEVNGTPIIGVDVLITIDGFEYILQSLNSDTFIENMLLEFSKLPFHDYGAENVILSLHLYDFLSEDPEGEVYKYVEIEEWEDGWYVYQFLGQIDGWDNSVTINTDLLESYSNDTLNEVFIDSINSNFSEQGSVKQEGI